MEKSKYPRAVKEVKQLNIANYKFEFNTLKSYNISTSEFLKLIPLLKKSETVYFTLNIEDDGDFKDSIYWEATDQLFVRVRSDKGTMFKSEWGNQEKIEKIIPYKKTKKKIKKLLKENKREIKRFQNIGISDVRILEGNQIVYLDVLDILKQLKNKYNG